jgi:hypothetical protein
MRVLNGDVKELASAASQVFPLALATEVTPVLAAIVIAVVVVISRTLMQRRTAAARGPASR